MTGKTARERYLAGEGPRDHDREDQAKFAEYAIRRTSDADLVYARQEAILRGHPAGVAAA